MKKTLLLSAVIIGSMGLMTSCSGENASSESESTPAQTSEVTEETNDKLEAEIEVNNKAKKLNLDIKADLDSE